MICKDQDVNKKALHIPVQHLVKFALRKVSLKILKRPLTHHCILAEKHIKYMSIQWKVTKMFHMNQTNSLAYFESSNCLILLL